ncbi:MAG TPA: glycoside hydrolase family 95 protein [Candidatus Limiplasma sp.]|nr:glycoside hydrolase family 95 protein [Candidatus Limiplasma sp.]
MTPDAEHTLWYRQEATRWEEALPLGNGRIGAMIFGGAAHERIALNEDTLWSGYPACGDKRGAAKYFPIVRDLTLQGKYAEAQAMIERHMQGADTQFYLPLGDLLLDFDDIHQAGNYTRSLSLREAVCTTEFISGGVRCRREAFVSAPDQALYLRLTADTAGALAFTCSLQSQLRHRSTADMQGLTLTGICPSGMADGGRRSPAVYARCDDRKGMRFFVHCEVHTNGRVRVASGGKLSVAGATQAVLRLFARTSFNGFARHPFTDGRDEQALCRADQAKATRDFNAALRRHIADHQALYSRCALHLDSSQTDLPTDERLTAAQDTDDPALDALMFHYGRYLLIAGSRQGTQPLNLQGIWNEHLCAPWRGNYTLNINTEMNYWPAEVCGLPECHQPLFAMIGELLHTGARTAETVYGARGAAVHHNTDLWRLSNPVSEGITGSAVWAFWPMALGWLCLHMTEHYQYTRDLAFLKNSALPALRASARFYLDILTDRGDGRLAIVPATSPENTFQYHGKSVAVAKSSQMSISIVRTVFAQYLKAADTLHIPETMTDEVRRTLPLLPDYAIGPRGELLEWDAPYVETEPHHRHASHLFDLFPGDAVSPEHTPLIAAACRQTLLLRGDAGTGWSMGWKINLWARLGNGGKALCLLHRQLCPAQGDTGGTYPNLFDAHPPFQIDGNFGACSGIAQMLVRSDDDKIHLLPALPIHWSGAVHGLCAPGGVRVDIRFQNGKLADAAVGIPVGATPPILYYQGKPVSGAVRVYPLKG